MNTEQTDKILVGVKYRSEWSNNLLLDGRVLAQLEHYKNIILIVINTNPSPPSKMKTHKTTGAYIRCVSLKHKDGKNLVKWRANHHEWVEIPPDRIENYQ